jgi:UDP-3-O-[3-hydroxymyristoyl] glucosamine N-acyltransferase
MKFPSPVSISWLAEFIEARIIGDAALQALGINEIHRVEQGDLVFVDHPKYYDTCFKSAADFIIINQAVEPPPGKVLLVVDQPFEAYQKIVRHFRPFSAQQQMIASSAQIGEGTYIAPNVFIGAQVVIGKNCFLHPGVVIRDYTVIGNNVVVQSNTVIGSDAFYYNTKKNREVWYQRMESGGSVVIEDDVEIGAGCTIDRGVSSETRIGRGTKIDNLVHIGHDTIVEENCLFAAQVGIAGATTIQKGVILWGQVGVSKTLTIGENAVLLAQSGVPSSLEGNKSYFGTPAEDARIKKRELVWIKRIPELWKKLSGEE